MTEHEDEHDEQDYGDEEKEDFSEMYGDEMKEEEE